MVTVSGSLTAEQVFRQCLVAFGSGTGGVPTDHAAIEKLVEFYLPKFGNAMNNDPERFADGDCPHKLEKQFVLRCSEAVGRLAAHHAIARGYRSIAAEDVEYAFFKVNNINTFNPGDWCN
jgi:hypothetical protein